MRDSRCVLPAEIALTHHASVIINAMLLPGEFHASEVHGGSILAREEGQVVQNRESEEARCDSFVA